MPRPDNDNTASPFKRFGVFAMQVIGGLITLAVITQMAAGALE